MSQSKAKAESELKKSEASYKLVVEQLRSAEKSKFPNHGSHTVQPLILSLELSFSGRLLLWLGLEGLRGVGHKP